MRRQRGLCLEGTVSQASPCGTLRPCVAVRLSLGQPEPGTAPGLLFAQHGSPGAAWETRLWLDAWACPSTRTLETRLRGLAQSPTLPQPVSGEAQEGCCRQGSRALQQPAQLGQLAPGCELRAQRLSLLRAREFKAAHVKQ